MRKKFLALIVFLFVPIVVFAEKNETILSEEVKYYKTTIFNAQAMNIFSVNQIENTVEISKDEYYSFDNNNYVPNTTIETEYKKMTTTISSVNSYYRYKVKLEWKNIPKIRSYDTIAIGFPASVKPKLSPIFSENYCTSDGNCYNATGYHYLYSGSNGIGVTFQVPTGNIKTMDQTLYIDMQKNTTATINTQYAYGDYAHAVKSISLDKAKNYTVTTVGIKYDSSNITYYDEINYARATWKGTW